MVTEEPPPGSESSVTWSVYQPAVENNISQTWYNPVTHHFPTIRVYGPLVHHGMQSILQTYSNGKVFRSRDMDAKTPPMLAGSVCSGMPKPYEKPEAVSSSNFDIWERRGGGRIQAVTSPVKIRVQYKASVAHRPWRLLTKVLGKKWPSGYKRHQLRGLTVSHPTFHWPLFSS